MCFFLLWAIRLIFSANGRALNRYVRRPRGLPLVSLSDRVMAGNRFCYNRLRHLILTIIGMPRGTIDVDNLNYRWLNTIQFIFFFNYCHKIKQRLLTCYLFIATLTPYPQPQAMGIWASSKTGGGLGHNLYAWQAVWRYH